MGVWNKLITEWIQVQPLVSGPFAHIDIKTEGENGLVFGFSSRAHYSLVQNQKKYLNHLKQFLKAKLNDGVQFSIRCELQQDELDSAKEPLSEVPTLNHRNVGEDELVEAEPIIGYIIEKFDGRLVI